MSITRVWCSTCGWQPLGDRGRLYWSVISGTNRHRWTCPSCGSTHDRTWDAMCNERLMETLPTEDCPPVDGPLTAREIQSVLERIETLSEA